MHVKYASRHVLYPVPNVDVSLLITVARAVLAGEALRDTETIFFGVPFVAVRAVLGCVALRDTVLVVRAIDVVALRAVVLVRPLVRDKLVWRLMVVVGRTVFVELDVRADTILGVVVVRMTFVASRTAASAMPTPAQHAAIKSQTFFILCDI